MGRGRRPGRAQPRRSRQPDGLRRAGRFRARRQLRGDDRGGRASGCSRSTTTCVADRERDAARRSQRQHRRRRCWRGARRCAVLWAGDSRVYRWRAGRLEQLTRDHSLAELEGVAAAGLERHHPGGRRRATLTLDLQRDAVRAGRPVPALLGRPDPRRARSADRGVDGRRRTSAAAVDGLIKATLDAGAPDNVTVLIVEAYA